MDDVEVSEKAAKMKDEALPEVTYKGVQKDEGAGKEIDVKVRECKIRIEWSPNYKNILIFRGDSKNPMKIPLDEDSGNPNFDGAQVIGNE